MEAALASGTDVFEAMDSFAAEAGADPRLFSQAMSEALAGGGSVEEAVQTAAAASAASAEFEAQSAVEVSLEGKLEAALSSGDSFSEVMTEVIEQAGIDDVDGFMESVVRFLVEGDSPKTAIQNAVNVVQEKTKGQDSGD
jgi:hypothetical protein